MFVSLRIQKANIPCLEVSKVLSTANVSFKSQMYHKTAGYLFCASLSDSLLLHCQVARSCSYFRTSLKKSKSHDHVSFVPSLFAELGSLKCCFWERVALISLISRGRLQLSVGFEIVSRLFYLVDDIVDTLQIAHHLSASDRVKNLFLKYRKDGRRPPVVVVFVCLFSVFHLRYFHYPVYLGRFLR